ncbi:hypothetical protein ACSF83_07110 [Lactobacillus johnsonii]|uniref:hypothetical protein n=1 Tax=Lactobacillus johnsonii TaxID=33959 RepID=UPI003F50DA4A
MKYNIKQFVDFKRVNELNEWLRLYSNRIILDDWQTVKRDDFGVTYILQFHLAPFTAMQLEDEENMSYEEQLKDLLQKAYELQ